MIYMSYMIGLRIFAISMRSAILPILFILSRTDYSTDVLAFGAGGSFSLLWWTPLIPSGSSTPAFDHVPSAISRDVCGFPPPIDRIGTRETQSAICNLQSAIELGMARLLLVDPPCVTSGVMPLPDRASVRGNEIVNRQQFLATVENAWQALDDAIAGLDESALAEPGVVGAWSVIAVLGHVTAWEQQALRHIEQWQGGEPLSLVSGPAVNGYNTVEAARRRGWSLSQVRAEQRATRQRLRAAVEALSDDDWTTILTAGDGRMSLGDVIAGDLAGDNPGDHATEHARQILAWRTARQAGEDQPAAPAANAVQERSA
jgi:DinB superfamily